MAAYAAACQNYNDMVMKIVNDYATYYKLGVRAAGQAPSGGALAHCLAKGGVPRCGVACRCICLGAAVAWVPRG